jgi:hypothetical protein
MPQVAAVPTAATLAMTESDTAAGGHTVEDELGDELVDE